MRKRTIGRELALQALYQLDVCGDGVASSLADFCRSWSDDSEAVSFALAIVNGCMERIRELDKKISSVAENWDLNRMAVIDRTVLRIAVYELFYGDDVPPKVAINEAIDLAKRYSTAHSGAFVNGILDKIGEELLSERGLAEQATEK